MGMYYTYLDTPIGPVFFGGDGENVSVMSFTSGHQCRKPEPDWKKEPSALSFATDQVEEYFRGDRTEFDFPLTVEGTPFQKAVWDVLLTIPFGETRTYGEVAEIIGRPKASRAVGAANGANHLPLVIPCHRVIGTSGRLTGFGGGLPTKEWLLRFEGAIPEQEKSLF